MPSPAPSALPTSRPTQWPTVDEQSIVAGGITFSGIALWNAIANEVVFRRCIANIVSIEDVAISVDHVTKVEFVNASPGAEEDINSVNVQYEVTLSSTNVENVHKAFEDLAVADWDFALQYSASTVAEKNAFANVKTETVDLPWHAKKKTDDDEDAGWLGFLEKIPVLSGLSPTVLAVVVGALLVVCVGGTLLCVVCAGKGGRAKKRGLAKGESIEDLDFGNTFGKGQGKKPRFEMT